MGLVTKIGLWLDKRFPEKVTAEEVYRKLADLESAKQDATAALDTAKIALAETVKIAAQVEKFAGELKAARDLAGVRARIMPSTPARQAVPPGIAR